MSAANPNPTPAPLPLNFEQLEAEMVAGMGQYTELSVNLTQIAHLVMACQIALKQDAGVVHLALWRDMATDLEKRIPWPPEMAKLITEGWR